MSNTNHLDTSPCHHQHHRHHITLCCTTIRMEPFELLPPVGAKTLMEGIYEMARRLDPTPS